MQRPANFEEIKDANQLQEFLAFHKVKAGNKKTAAMPGVVAANQNEYQGMKQKPVKPINPKKLLSDRYGKESTRRMAEPVNDYSAEPRAGEPHDDEHDDTRSLAAELDYTKKDASRHIVQAEATNRQQRLRERLLKNLDGIRLGNAAIAKSAIGSTRQSYISGRSMRSRRTSAGAENAPDRASQPFMEKIQEDQREERNETGLSMKHNAAKEPQP